MDIVVRLKNVFSLYVLSLLILLAGCGGSGGSSSDTSDNLTPEVTNPVSGAVAGVVRDYITGEPISGARVAANTAQSDAVQAGETAADGGFVLNGLGIHERLVVTASAEGYGEYSIITASREQASGPRVEISLLPAHLVQSFDPSQSQVLSVEGLGVVEFNANAFLTEANLPPTGDVTATITLIDPSSDPGLMPGGYEAVSATGEQGLMESWGAITATFTDATGADLQLAAGQIATIRIPVAAARAGNTPVTIPLFYFDEDAAIWREEGIAALSPDEAYYEGTVTHFTTWNADLIYETVMVTGRVVNEAGQPIAGASIFSQGRDYIGSSQAVTGADGRFSIPVRMGSELLIAAASESLSNTLEISVADEDYALPDDIVLAAASVSVALTWGENPTDLDTHFLGPVDESGSQEFEVYYGNQQVYINEEVVQLDVDDVSSFGPEILTLSGFPYPGTYRYLVHLYDGAGTILNSPARVEVTIGEETTVFSPAQAVGEVDEWWAVANFLVDTTGSVTLQPVQEWRASELNPIMAPVEPMALGIQREDANVIKNLLKRKYYAE